MENNTIRVKYDGGLGFTEIYLDRYFPASRQRTLFLIKNVIKKDYLSENKNLNILWRYLSLEVARLTREKNDLAKQLWREKENEHLRRKYDRIEKDFKQMKASLEIVNRYV